MNDSIPRCSILTPENFPKCYLKERISILLITELFMVAKKLLDI